METGSEALLKEYRRETRELRERNTQLEKQSSNFQEQIAQLSEQLEWFKRQIFGQKSERVIEKPNAYQPFFEGFEDIKNNPIAELKKVEAHERKKPQRNGRDSLQLPADLPEETRILDISAQQKKDLAAGIELIKIGEEVQKKLAHKPGSYFILRTVRPKYVVAGDPEQGVVTADLPDGILTKCKADESFLADLLVRKFADHLPLYRISEGLKRYGIGLSRKLLSQWVVKIGQELKPLHQLLHQQIVASGHVFIDESPVKMQQPGRGKTHQGYMWVLAGGEDLPMAQVYHYRTSRKHEVARELLTGFRGFMHSDKYGAYEELAKRKEITWCPCMNHIRRKFYEAEAGDREFREWVLGKIQELFLLERQAWEEPPDERLRIRKELEEPILDEMIAQVKQRVQGGNALPKSKYREALHYCYSLIPHLKNYFKSAQARLDNNVAERAVRALAIGRKNWLFVGSPKAGESAAVLLSLVQTCRGIGVNPRDYLEDVFRRFQGHPMHRLHELLPMQWSQAREESQSAPTSDPTPD